MSAQVHKPLAVSDDVLRSCLTLCQNEQRLSLIIDDMGTIQNLQGNDFKIDMDNFYPPFVKEVRGKTATIWHLQKALQDFGWAPRQLWLHRAPEEYSTYTEWRHALLKEKGSPRTFDPKDWTKVSQSLNILHSPTGMTFYRARSSKA